MNRMKRLLTLLVFPVIGYASDDVDFRIWKDILGREFEAKMVGSTSTKVKLENRAGKQIEMYISDFLKTDREYIQSKGRDSRSEGFVKAEKGNSPILKVKKENSPILKAVRNKTLGELNPNADYFALYFSAHWCLPCRAFTKKLSKFYNTNFSEGCNFDILFISSDRDEKEMQEHINWGDMKFPALKYESKKRATEINKYACRGIPCLVLVDRDGEIIADSDAGEDYLGHEHVLKKLKELSK